MNKINKTHILILLTGMFFLGMSGTDIYVSSLPEMVKVFNTTPNIVNYSLSVYTFGVAVLVLFSSVLSNRFGRRKVLLWGLAVFTFSAYLISFSNSIWMIIILRLVQSAGPAIIIIVSRLILKDIMNEREQIKANGIILMGLILSPALAPMLGAFLADNFGWRSCFIFTGITGTVLLLFTLKILPETNNKMIAKLPPVKSFILNYFRFFGDRLFLGLTIIYICSVAAFFSYIGISSYLYIDKLSISPIVYSYTYLFLAFAYLSGNQYMLFLNKKYVSYAKIISVGVYSALFGVCIIFLAYFLRSNIAAAVIITLGVIFMRAANALINPTTQVLLMNHFGTKGGEALGLLMCLNFIMIGLSIFLVTLFYERPMDGLLIVSTIFTVAAVAGFLLSKKQIIESRKNDISANAQNNAE